GNARREIDDPGTARRHAHAGFLQQPTIGLAHEGSRLFVPHIKGPDTLLDAGGFGEQHRPPMRKNRISVPSFLSDRARISEPVSCAILGTPWWSFHQDLRYAGCGACAHRVIIASFDAALSPAYTTSSVRKAAISCAFRPSQSPSTSSVCCPSCGAGRMVGGA